MMRLGAMALPARPRTAAPTVLSGYQRIVGLHATAAILVLPCIIGSLASVLAILAAVALLPISWRRGAARTACAEPAVVLQVIVFCVLALLFVATARTAYDLAYITNFLALALAPLVFLAARMEVEADVARLFVRMCLAGVTLGAIYAVVEIRFLGAYRAAGFFSNPNVMGRIAELLGFAALAGVWLSDSRARFVYYLGPVLAAVVIVATESRGAAVGVPVLAGLALVCLLADRRTRRHVPVLVAAFAVVVVALAASHWSDRITATPSAILDTLSGDAVDINVSIRLSMYRAALDAFQLSPIIGQGWGNLGNAAAAVDPQTLGWAATEYFMFHNDVLNFAVAGGIVGVACLLVLLAAPLAGLYRRRRQGAPLPLVYLALVLTLGYGTLGLTDMTFGYDVETTLYAFFSAIVFGAFQSRRRPA